MARGDMAFDTLTVGGEVEILNRKEFEAVSMTVDFTNVDAGADGVKVVKAGTPIDKDGKVVAATPWAGAIGLLLHDAYEKHPQVAVLKEGYVNTGRAQTHSGKTYDAALVTALVTAGCRIAFEDPIISSGGSGSSN